MRDRSKSGIGKTVVIPKRIGVRIWDWSEWSRQVVRGVQHFAHGRPNWQVITYAASKDREKVFKTPGAWDGIVTAVLGETRFWKRLLDEGNTKIVSITAAVPSVLKEVPGVRVDDLKVAEMIGRHLLAGGFRRIAYPTTQDPRVIDHRAMGLKAFANQASIPLDIFRSPRYRSRTDLPLTELTRWIKKLSKPVGIVTWNMDNARKIIEVCSKAGINVPTDVAFVAWDDDVLIAETLKPTITGVVMPAERLGFEAAKLLDQLLAGQPRPSQAILVPPSGIMHIRESSDVLMLPDRDVHLASQYIREHATEDLKVTGLANAIGISRRKLEQDFRRVKSQTPHEAITQARLERAKQLLIETEWPLTRIAAASGMGTKQTLIRVALRHLKVTPGNYRRQFGPGTT